LSRTVADLIQWLGVIEHDFNGMLDPSFTSSINGTTHDVVDGES